MDDLQQKLNAILSDPGAMENIMSMAQSLGLSNQETSEPPAQTTSGSLDPGMLTMLTSLAGKTGIDKNQQNLLTALHPYVGQDRLRKLEKAMRAAKMAGMATTLFGSETFSFR